MLHTVTRPADIQALISRQCSQEGLYLRQPTCFICSTSQPPFLVCRQAAPRGGGSCSDAQLRPDQHFPATSVIWYAWLAHAWLVYVWVTASLQPH